jgi:hypothetical protein
MTIPPRGPMQNNTDVKNIDNYAPRGLHFPGTGKYPPAATIGAPFSSSSAADRASSVRRRSAEMVLSCRVGSGWRATAARSESPSGGSRAIAPYSLAVTLMR